MQGRSLEPVVDKPSGVDLFPAGNHLPTDLHDEQFPSRLASWQDGVLELGVDGTHFGFIRSGSASLECDSGTFHLQAGMYFSVPGKCILRGEGDGFVATRCSWMGLFQIGGPTEPQGRLKYIDGCSDSLLISPIVLGDPCLNLLYLPPGTEQTQHTHPSCRAGIIASGSGVCRTPEEDLPLSPGTIFNIAAGGLHSFHTGVEELRVIAWHPDSDFGPAHHDHPMINRTMIDGRSAAHLNAPQPNEGVRT